MTKNHNPTDYAPHGIEKKPSPIMDTIVDYAPGETPSAVEEAPKPRSEPSTEGSSSPSEGASGEGGATTPPGSEESSLRGA